MSEKDQVQEPTAGSLFGDLEDFQFGILTDDLLPDHEKDGDGNDPKGDTDDTDLESDESAEDQTPTEDTTDAEAADTATELPEGSDERVMALYELAKAEGFTDEIEGFTGSLEDAGKLVETIGVTAFNSVMESMDPLTRDLIDYALRHRGQLTPDAARKFFDEYVAPAQEFTVPTNDEQANDYLFRVLKAEGLFPSDKKIQEHLDDLLEEGKLLEIAKRRAEKEKQSYDTQRERELERLRQAEEEQAARQRQFFNSVVEDIKAQPWADKVKQAALQSVDPNRTRQINAKVSQSPKAVAQLALLYSYFDEEKGVFDLSAFANQRQSKVVEKEKNDLVAKRAQALARIGRKSKNTDTGPGGSLLDDLKTVNTYGE